MESATLSVGRRSMHVAGLEEADVLRALQHPGQALVLHSCMARARAAQEIMDLTGIPSVTCYRLIHQLETFGLLIVERGATTGRGRPFDLYRSTVEWARLEVTADGVRAVWWIRMAMADRLQRLWHNMEKR